jgi:hypothetical protein
MALHFIAISNKYVYYVVFTKHFSVIFVNIGSQTCNNTRLNLSCYEAKDFLEIILVLNNPFSPSTVQQHMWTIASLSQSKNTQ